MDNVNFLKIKTDQNKLYFQDLEKVLALTEIQYFNPIYENFDKYIHEPNITIKSKYIVDKIKTSSNNLENDDNNSYIKTFIDASVKNVHTNITTDIELFVKYIPIIDPIEEIIKDTKNANIMLPNNYNYNISEKVNNFQNSSYLDFFFTFLGSKLSESGKCPCFPIFYGTLNGMKQNYMYDLSDDYSQVKYHNNFQRNLNKNYELVIKQITDNDSDSDSDNDSDNDSDSDIDIHLEILNNVEFQNIKDIIDEEFKHTLNNNEKKNLSLKSNLEEIITINDDNYEFENIFNECDNNVKYIQFKEFPVQCVFMEKLSYTLEDLIRKENYDISDIEWKSIFFQICFGLAVAQKKFNLVHNDLHCENIMFQDTHEEYIYYEYENNCYRIPTFGKITKIIDFGRATFTHNNIIYFSDAFDENGDAGGQYDYPHNNSFKGCKLKPNPSFDLARLSSTIIEYFDKDTDLYKLLKTWITDKYNYFLYNDPDDFDLYKNIAKNVTNAIPMKQLKKSIFKKFTIKKDLIPKNIFVYTY
jgi:hypothetical protein